MDCSTLINHIIGIIAKHGDIEVYVAVGKDKENVKPIDDVEDCRDINGTRFIALEMENVIKNKQDLNR